MPSAVTAERSSADRCIVVPVRHHSPACARLVETLIRAYRPERVLIEGPSDATHLIPAMIDPGTIPPIALLAYFQDGSRPGPNASLFYPFCEYSPEWVAMREGALVGADIRFCDLPSAAMLSHDDEQDAPHGPELGQAVARAYGFDHHEDWWEALFEGPAHPAAALMRLLLAYGDEVAGSPDRFTEEREAWMWAAVVEAVDNGVPPEKVMLVCGAAHASRLPRGAEPRPVLGELPAVQMAVTPYTFTHLSRQSGYGAGNLTPLLWQRAWTLGGLNSAAAASLVDVAGRLRAGGWDASTADAIAAFATARQLAGLRDKEAPGADEVRLAASTAWPDQRSGGLSKILDEALVGSQAGIVGSASGETPLMADFRRQARRFWRALDATEREERLRLTVASEVEKSHFLHRSRIAGIEFARLRDARASAQPESSLWTRYEVWIRRWTPQTEISLAELSPAGSSVREVACRSLEARLSASPPLSKALEALLDSAVAGIEELLLPAIGVIESASVLDCPWEDLALATARLSRLDADAGIPAAVRAGARDLVSRLYARACLHLPLAACCTAERAVSLGQALLELHNAVTLSSEVDAQIWWRAVDRVILDDASQPYLSGLGAALSHSLQRMSEAALSRLVRLKLSSVERVDNSADFIEGLLALNRSILLRSTSLAAALQEFVGGLSPDRFRATLPLLRRTFQGLSKSEMRQFVAALRPALSRTGSPAAPESERSPLEVVDDLRRALSGLLEEGDFERFRPKLLDRATDLAALADADSRRCAELISEYATSKGGARDIGQLLNAWDLLRRLRLRWSVTQRSTPPPPVPGLSLTPPPEARSPLLSARGDEEMEALAAVMTDARQQTRPGRVALVAEALAGGHLDTFDAVAPLLAHGDYTRLIVRSFSATREAPEIAQRCLKSANHLIQRSGIEIAGRVLLTEQGRGRRECAATLTLALRDEMLWPLAFRHLKQYPDALREAVEALEPEPCAVSAGSPEEAGLARAARALSGSRGAVPWLQACLGGPDRLALEAAVSLTLLGELSEDELTWTATTRGGEAGAVAMRRMRIERQVRRPALLVELEIDTELAGSLDDDLIAVLIEKEEAGKRDNNRGAAFAEFLGFTQSRRAVPTLSKKLSGSHPLVAVSAAEALGRIGSERAIPVLLSRKPARGSDLDCAILSAIGEIGDLRSTGWFADRLRRRGPEEILEAEMRSIAAMGEVLRLALPGWLDDGSPTLRAAAETLLEPWAPDAVEQWRSAQSDSDRLQQLCLRILIAGADVQNIAERIGTVAERLPSSELGPIVRALTVASGPSETALVELLARLKIPSLLLPVLRIPRAAPWKITLAVSMGAAALPILSAAANDPDKHVARAAKEALDAAGSPKAAGLSEVAGKVINGRAGKR